MLSKCTDLKIKLWCFKEWSMTVDVPLVAALSRAV